MTSTRVFIYGSCVSRDTFEHLDPSQFELVQYVARQSALSATTRPVSLVAPPGMTSRFQQRMIEGDFGSNLRPLLQKYANETDVLLIDLTDERLGVYLLPDGTVVTRSVELIESGAEQSLPSGTHYVQFGTQQHFEYWSGAIRALGDIIRSTMPHVSVALLDLPWAEWSESGDRTPDSFGVGASQANPVFRPYIEAAVTALNAHVISLGPDQVSSGPHHPWGDAPFHYSENVYLETVRRLTGSEGRVVWGPGADARAKPSSSTGATPRAKAQPASKKAAGTPGTVPLSSGPSFVLSGTHRGGTLWLQRRLEKHTDVYFGAAGTTNYFARKERFTDAQEAAKYAAEFTDPHRLGGERSPTYFWHANGSAFSPKRIDTAAAIRDALHPSAKVVLTLRDPVSRAVSAYWSYFASGKFDLPTSMFQLPTNLGVVDLGFYKRHYEHWASVLGADRIVVLLQDDLEADPQDYLRQALTGLGLDPARGTWSAAELKKRENVKTWLKPFKARAPIDAQEIGALLQLYKTDIAFVESLVGRKLPGWKSFRELRSKLL
ncbi:DUF6270 domain-containing protein [Promicromonospora aerolata]|uniref:DUF6270 domain-containing protein n=1 Tax=Promicromonospora aerolata TaxID=195749 RepID=A0ABW4V9Q2_9MICO